MYLYVALDDTLFEMLLDFLFISHSVPGETVRYCDKRTLAWEVGGNLEGFGSQQEHSPEYPVGGLVMGRDESERKSRAELLTIC